MSGCCKKLKEVEEYPNHSELIPRLNRIKGQIDGVGKMIEDRRYCVEILSQMTAIQSALRACEAKLLERHLTSCIHSSIASKNSTDAEKKIKEMVDFFKKRMK
ncbi:MAG TPA: metal-sensitive transcriptional regulator [Oligoflexia bacterium]|nr:metal-sensitive transcriptional regulator [Oligoflexia bacterium]HMP49523.1 metal-sensitive transcriptional regulator [Oligoflexia bacterium]